MAFSDYVPGWWSSHPEALKKQRKVFVFGALLPLALVVAAGIWAFVDCGGWQKLLHPFTASFSGELAWLKLVAVTACATGGAYVTLTLLHGLAMVGDYGDGDRLPFPVWVLVLTLFSWMAPIGFWFYRHYCLPPGRLVVFNIFLNGLCFLPVAAIVLWIKIHGVSRKEREKRKTGIGRMLFRAVLCTLAAAAAAWREMPFRVVWGCAWGALALLLWCVVLIRLAKAGKKSARTAEGDDGPPEWLERVVNKLPEGIALEDGVALVPVPDAVDCDPHPDPVLLLLMDGRIPTIDQSAFFSRFRTVHDNAWRKLYEENKPKISSVGCNLLLTGVEGSGRTEMLLAAALYAALVQGECVLYFAASREQARALKEKADARIRGLMVGDYVKTEVLTHSAMKSFLHRKAGTALPSILFATPEQVEGDFFEDSMDVDAASVERIHEIVLTYGTVLVDDFCEHSHTVRAHLAFLLDKWRLVLANGCVIPQFVVALPPVYDPDGVRALGERLFGSTGFSVSGDIARLRPRKTAPYWEGTIRIAANLEVDKAVCGILDLCLAERLNVVYYSHGMSGQEKEAIAKNLGAHEGFLRLLSNIDEVTDADAGADAVLHLSLTSGRASAAMRLHTGARQAVFLRIVSEAEVELPPTDGQLIPLPDETGTALMVHHLKSVLKFIPPLTPVDAAVWNRFGISMTSGTMPPGRRGNDEVVPARWFCDSWAELADGIRVAPCIVLENAAGLSTNGYHIGAGGLPSPAETLWKTDIRPGGQRIFLAPPEDAGNSAGSVVEWRDNPGNPLGESDLAHVGRFECLTEWNAFVLDKFREVERNNSRHALVAVGKFSRGAGVDPVYPERTLSWNPADGSPCGCEEPVKVGNFAMFRLVREGNPAVKVSGLFSGVVNALGRLEERAARSYDYDAYVSGIVLAPCFSPSDAAETKRRLSPLVSRPFSTVSEHYSPILTHAFSAAVAQMFDGAAFYAFTPAFWCGGGREAAGKAVVWFLEPADSGRALFPFFGKMRDNPKFLKTFFSLVKEFAGKFDSVAKMRAASHVAVKGDAFSDSDRRRAKEVAEILVAENEEVEKAETTGRRTRPPVRRVVENYSQEEREFDRVVVGALMNFEPEIDVTKFAAEYKWDSDRICDVFFDVLWNNPQVFFVTKRAHCQWTHCGEIVTRFVITGIRYAFDKEAYPARKKELDDAVAKAMETVAGIGDAVAKAKALHDYIVRICEYDKRAADENDTSPLARTVYSVLVRHSAVCEGYTMAYRYLLDKVGIRSEEVISDEMNHCWNYVEIGGNWYHVDVTWDDPMYAGKDPEKAPILYDNFLLSDSAIRARNHHDWDVRGLPEATDATYDGRNWNVPDF